MRVKNAQRFLTSGHTVKSTAMFRGHEIQHSDLPRQMLQSMAKDLEEIAEVQQAPKQEGRNMMMLLTLKKQVIVSIHAD